MRGQTMTQPFIKIVLTIILAGINNRHKQQQKHWFFDMILNVTKYIFKLLLYLLMLV